MNFDFNVNPYVSKPVEERPRPKTPGSAGKTAFALFAALVVCLCLATAARAEGDPLTVVNNLSTFIFSLILTKLGFASVDFLGNAKVFPWTMIVSDVWKGFGYGTIVYLAALTGIDPSLYESAMLDGASRWQQIKNITIPLLMPTIVLMTVLSLGSVLNAGFDQIYNLYSPAVWETGDIIDTYVYRLGIQQAQYSVGAAVGLFKSLVSAIMVIVSYILADKLAGYRIL